MRAEDAPDERERGLIDRSSGGRECGCRGGCYSGGGGRGGGGEIPRHGLAGRSHGVGGVGGGGRERGEGGYIIAGEGERTGAGLGFAAVRLDSGARRDLDTIRYVEGMAGPLQA